MKDKEIIWKEVVISDFDICEAADPNAFVLAKLKEGGIPVVGDPIMMAHDVSSGKLVTFVSPFDCTKTYRWYPV